GIPQTDLISAIRASIIRLYSPFSTWALVPDVPVTRPTTMLVGTMVCSPAAICWATLAFSLLSTRMSPSAVKQLMGGLFRFSSVFLYSIAQPAMRAAIATPQAAAARSALRFTIAPLGLTVRGLYRRPSPPQDLPPPPKLPPPHDRAPPPPQPDPPRSHPPPPPPHPPPPQPSPLLLNPAPQLLE